MINLVKGQKIAKEAVLKAGKAILKNKQNYKIEKIKEDPQDFATSSDLLAEKIIIKIISDAFPKHNILSEEKGVIDNNSPYCWVIDPLDGTRDYSRNIPNFFVNVSLEFENEIVVGVVYSPPTRNLFSAAKGKGAKLNGEKIEVSKRDLDMACVCTSLSDYRMNKKLFEFSWKKFEKIAKKFYRLRGMSHDIGSLCYLAMGAVEGYFLINEPGKCSPMWWDVSAGILIAKEAGAKVTDLKGNSKIDHNISNGIIAASPKIHKQLLKLLNKEKYP